MIDYSIIIPAYNEELLLPATIRKLRAGMDSLSEMKGEILVVDNNSSDSTADVARKNGARVVFEPINQISRARNAGAREAFGRFLLFVDADTLVPEKLLRDAVHGLAYEEFGAGGSTLRFERLEGKSFLISELPNLWNYLSRGLHLAAGSFLFVRKDAFEAVGGFSKRVYAGEEIFLSNALKRWCRKNKKLFRIVTRTPVLTSSRKLQWFSPFRLLSVILLPLVCPLVLYSKRFCSFWYVRPKAN